MIETPFNSLSAAASRALVDASRLHNFDEGDVVFSDGEPGSSMFLISTGLLAVQIAAPGREGSGGKPNVTVAVRGPGEMVGEMALFSRAKLRTATVVARTGTRLLGLDEDAWNALRSQHPEIDALFLRVLAERLASLSWHLAAGPYCPPKVCLARVLLQLPVPSDPARAVEVTVADLSGLSGIDPVEISTTLAALEAADLIKTESGVRVLNRAALRAVGSVL